MTITRLSKMPVEEARVYYGGTFQTHLDEVMSKWYVYSDPTIFVMAYPYSADLIRQGEMNKVVDNPDCWVIHFFSGEMTRLFEIAPAHLPHVAFQRGGGKWKVYETEMLDRKLRR